MLGLGLSLLTGGAVSPEYVKLSKAFVTRVEADGGTVESFACLKTDMAYLNSNPDAPTGYAVEWSGATVGSSAEFRIILIGGAGYTYTYAVTDSQATEVTGTGVMGGDIQAVTADLSTLVDGAVTVAVYLTGAGGDGPVVTDTATLVGVDADYQAILDRGTALGYTLPSPSQQVLQEALIADLKTAGVWDKLDLFYVFATDGDSDYATLNWKAPSSFQLTKTNSPTFTTNEGFAQSGTAYLDSGYDLSTDGTNYTQDDAGVFGAFPTLSSTSQNNNRPFGGDSQNYFSFRLDTDNTTANRAWINSTSFGAMTIHKKDDSIHFFNRTASNAIDTRSTHLSTANTYTDTFGISSTAAYSENFIILKSRATDYFETTANIGVVALGASLTTAEMEAVETAWYTNYFTSL